MLAAVDPDAEFLALGPIINDSGRSPVHASPDVSVQSLPATLKVDTALVAASGLELQEVEPVLARLRDVYATRIVLEFDRADAHLDALRALGFEPRKSPSGDGLLLVSDPATRERPREWNNSTHWANPENFKRYRW